MNPLASRVPDASLNMDPHSTWRTEMHAYSRMTCSSMPDNQDPLDSPDDVDTEKQYEEEPEVLPDDAGVNGEE